MPLVTGPSPQFLTKYSLTMVLGSGTTFVPPDKTIVMTAYLGENAKLNIMWGTDEIVGVTAERGYIGCTFCEGTEVGYKNISASGRNLDLHGVTLT